MEKLTAVIEVTQKSLVPSRAKGKWTGKPEPDIPWEVVGIGAEGSILRNFDPNFPDCSVTIEVGLAFGLLLSEESDVKIGDRLLVTIEKSSPNNGQEGRNV